MIVVVMLEVVVILPGIVKTALLRCIDDEVIG
jgi:hypothetical protein